MSSFTSWTVKILLAIVIILGAGLWMLSKLGGTSDSHRHGLEQAFSDALKADVTIQRIDEFNILPQLSIKAQGLRGVSRTSKNEYMADKVDLAFGLFDLALGKRRIENFQMENFRFSADSEYDLTIDKAGIVPGTEAVLSAQGSYKNQNFDLDASLQQGSDQPAFYYFGDETQIKGKFGDLDIAGEIKSGGGHNAVVLDVLAGGRVVAQAKGGKKNDKFEIWFECKKDIAINILKKIQILKEITFVKMDQSCSP